MKTYALLLGCLLFAVQGLSAQEAINFSDFEVLHIKGNLEVTLTQGEQTGVIIEPGEDRKVKLIQDGDRLTVRHSELFRYKSYRDFPIKVEIIYNELDELSVAAGARVMSEQTISNVRIDVKLRSGARAKLDLAADKCDLDVAEGAEGMFTGQVRQVTGVAATGGQLGAHNLIAERCKMRANTGGCARVQAKDFLDAMAHTGGTIIYAGNPIELVTNDGLGGNIHAGE